MVATVANSANGIAQLLGVVTPAAVANMQSGAQPGADVDATLFAQLMDGLTVEPPTLAAVPAVATNVELLNAKDEAQTSDSDISSDLLALSAIPMVIAIPPVPALIASETGPVSLPAATTQPPPTLLADASPVAASASPLISADPSSILSAGATSDTPVAAISPNVSTDAASTDATTFSATKPIDVQWLRAMTGITLGKSSAASTSVTDTRQGIAQLPIPDITAAPVNPIKPKAGSDLPTATPQNLLQFLAENTPPVLANAPRDAQQKLEAVDADKLVASTDALSGASTLAQPAGTALAEVNRSADAPTRLQLHNPVGSHQWATELGNKLTLLATRDTQSATLYMTPADLGPVQVRIDMNQDQASVWFTADHADTRTALEQALPRLRELFTAQGMSLTDAGVFGNRSNPQQQQPQSSANNAGPLGNFMSDDALADTATVRSISLGMLDAYA